MDKLKRRHYIVDMDFQSRFIVRFVFAMVLGMFVSILLFNNLTMDALESMKWRMVIYENSISEVVMPCFIYIAIFAIILAAFLLSVVSNYLHRDVMGVISRLKKDLEEVTKGNFRHRISIRNTDPFKESIEELDTAIMVLRDNMRNTAGVFHTIKGIIGSLGEVREELLLEKCVLLNANIVSIEAHLRKYSGFSPKS